MAEDWEELAHAFAAYRSGDVAAVRPLFEALQRRITGSLLAKGVRPEDAADLTQTILLKLHLSRDRYRSGMPLGAWVTTIMERSLVDFWRKSGRRSMVPLDEGEHAVADSDWQAFDPSSLLKIEDLQRRLTVLKPLDRQIVDMYAFDGLLLEEIGKRLGMSEGAVKLRLHRSRKILRALEVIIVVLLMKYSP